MTTPQFVEPKAFCSSPLKDVQPISTFKKEREDYRKYQSNDSSLYNEKNMSVDFNEKLKNQKIEF